MSTFPMGTVIGLSAFLLFAAAASAANRTVTSLADSGVGSLREAIDLVGIGETIIFAVTGTIELTSGKLLITDHLTITGPGASVLTITRRADAATHFPILVVSGGANVKITGLSLTKGVSLLEDLFPSSGIAVNSATLTLEYCAITGHIGYDGGGLSNRSGTLTVRNCLISGNHSLKGFSDGEGGGIYTDSGTTVVENSTFFDNRAWRGGGIYQIGGNLTVTHCTFSNNHTSLTPTLRPGNCIFVDTGGILNIASTILQPDPGTPALNAPVATPVATIISSGYNLCSDGGDGKLTGPGDRINSNPKLDPAGAQNNGGPTLTIALLSDSPAMDQGKSFGLTTDQRGQIRPRDISQLPNAVGGDGSDIGAFEAIDVQQTGPNFVVTSFSDHNDGIAGLEDCSLREAIGAANLFISPSTITFAAGVIGAITLDPQLGQLDVTAPVFLAGPGARKLALSGTNGVRPILSFGAGSTGSAISGLTIREAQRPGASVDGAGLFNQGELTVTDCAFTTNVATGFAGTQPGQAGGRARGGAVFNGGTLTLNRCTFNSNAARGGNGANNSSQFGSGGAGGAGLGGAIFNDTNATLFVNNCTFFNNAGVGGNGGSDLNFGGGSGGSGFGGVFNQGTLSMTSCTLSGNTATGGTGGLGNSGPNNGAPGTAGGGLNAAGGVNTVRNTISAGNTGGSSPDVSGAFTSQGWNLIGKNNGGSGFIATGDQSGTSASPLDAKLSVIGNYGGPNNTFSLLSGSPALDKGKAFDLTTDELNLPRRYDDPSLPNASGGDGTDIGAVEMQPGYSGQLKILSLTVVGPTARVVVQGTSFANYQLMKTETLTTSFANLGGPQAADSIGQTEFIDYGPLPAVRFFRAKAP